MTQNTTAAPARTVEITIEAEETETLGTAYYVAADGVCRSYSFFDRAAAEALVPGLARGYELADYTVNITL